MPVRVNALYADREHAEAVLAALLALGFRREQIVVEEQNRGRNESSDSGVRRLWRQLDDGEVIISVAVGHNWTIVRDLMSVNGAEEIATSGFSSGAREFGAAGDPLALSAHMPMVGVGQIEVRRGTPVIAADGVQLGTLDGLEEEALLVASGDILDLDWHIPLDLVEAISDVAVRLRRPATEVDRRPWRHETSIEEEVLPQAA